MKISKGKPKYSENHLSQIPHGLP